MNQQEDLYRQLRNIYDKDTLQMNCAFITAYVGIYELLADFVEERVVSFFCDEMLTDQNGNFKYTFTPEYREQIKNKRIDEKGNKDILKASMLWFVESGAITQEDYEIFLSLKELRNTFAHNTLANLCEGLYERHAEALKQLFELTEKIDRWWINEIEIPICGNDFSDDYERDSVTSIALQSYRMIINVLFCDKSEEYLKALDSVWGKDTGT